jgi:homoserine kinase type II
MGLQEAAIVLKTRRMAAYTRLARETAISIGRAFDLDVVAVAPVPAGAVNSNYRLTLANGESVFARIYEEQDRAGAEWEARLLDHLGRRGVLTPRPMPRCDGRGFTFSLEAAKPDAELVPSRGFGARPVAIFPWVAGQTLCQASVTEAVAHEVGGQLARVHLAAAGFCEPRAGRFRVEDIRARLGCIARAQDELLRALVPRIEQRLDLADSARDSGLPGGIIHGDLFRDNVLWENGRPVALLDFESASDGPWMYDLMVTVLAWCFADDLELQLVRALFSGYRQVREPTEREISSLATEGCIAALRFTVTRVTDFNLRSGIGERVTKDWRRFWARHERLSAIGNSAIARLFE